MKHTLSITTPSDREIAMTRSFAAPRALVFKALTEPAWLQQWLLGPDGWTMPVCEVDFRVGGRYRYVWRRPADGAEMAVGGVFRAISPPERVVATEQFEQPWYEGEALSTFALVERAGITTLTQTMLYASRQVRDAVLRSGMESGVAVSYDRLAALLASSEAARR